jgi:hypothetical protein
MSKLIWKERLLMLFEVITRTLPAGSVDTHTLPQRITAFRYWIATLHPLNT